eukprot:COSAG05_NODE_196_length_14546_cov_55.423548_17_plen_96_part_00
MRLPEIRRPREWIHACACEKEGAKRLSPFFFTCTETELKNMHGSTRAAGVSQAISQCIYVGSYEICAWYRDDLRLSEPTCGFSVLATDEWRATPL